MRHAVRLFADASGRRDTGNEEHSRWDGSSVQNVAVFRSRRRVGKWQEILSACVQIL